MRARKKFSGENTSEEKEVSEDVRIGRLCHRVPVRIARRYRRRKIGFRGSSGLVGWATAFR